MQTGDFATRIDYILGTISGPGHISEEFWLVPGETVLDDDVIDTLFGGADADWFLYDPEEDNVLDFDSQEDYATDIDP